MSFRFSHVVCPVAVLSLLVGGCASAPSSTAPAADEPSAAAALEAGAATAAAPEAVETDEAEEPAAAAAAAPGEPELWIELPEGEEWQTDEDGKLYFTWNFPKVEGTYSRISENRIRVTHGLPFDVAEEGDDYFLVKVYRVERQRSTTDRRAFAEPPAEVKVEVVEPQSDRYAFTAFDNGLPKQGQWRNGFVLVDFDGDGHMDIVHGPPRKQSPVPRIFLGDGAGNWRLMPIRELPPNLRLDYGDVAVADFDGDGRLDLALGVHIRGLVVLLHDGDGRFRSWSEGLPYAQPERGEGTGTFSTRTLAAVDWNGDGRPDIAAFGEGLRMVRPDATEFSAGASDAKIFLNGGDGTWESVAFGGTRHLRGEDMAIADLDGDGRPDLLAGSMSTGAAEILFFNREGGEGATIDPELLPGVPASAVIPAVAVGDFDGDGRTDVVIAYTALGADGWRSGIDLHLARGEGWERRPVLELSSHLQIGGLASGRLPGDDHLDLVAVDWTGRAWVFLGDGQGGFTLEASPELASVGMGCTGYAVELADLDGVPGDEIVIAYAGEPGGEMIFGQAPRCADEGGIAVWKAVPRR